jgi:hypothetical protein
MTDSINGQMCQCVAGAVKRCEIEGTETIVLALARPFWGTPKHCHSLSTRGHTLPPQRLPGELYQPHLVDHTVFY